jgi:hypothetical protein
VEFRSAVIAAFSRALRRFFVVPIAIDWSPADIQSGTNLALYIRPI